MLEKLTKQIKKQLGSEDVFEPPYEEFNIDWNDDPSEMLKEINQDLNYRLRNYNGRSLDVGNRLKQDIQTRYPYSFMFEGYGNCMVEITPEGNICYDFIKMIWKSQYGLDKCYCFRPDFSCFSDLDGLKKLCEYFYSVGKMDLEDKIEPMLIMDGDKVSWTIFTYTDYGNPYFDDEDLSLDELDRKYCDEWDLPESPEELSLEFEQQ